MKDGYGRTIEYLRISVTDGCDMRCSYCRSAEEPSRSSVILSSAEIEEVARAAAALGVKRVRLTGGEPLIRSDILDIVSAIARIQGISDLSLTTNGSRLAPIAGELKRRGLRRVNVSLDSLVPETYAKITGGGDLGKALSGIESAIAAGLEPVRINVVLVKGENDGEIGDFIEFTKSRRVDVRFIELMPIAPPESDYAARFVPAHTALAVHPGLKPEPRTAFDEESSGGPARYYRVSGYLGRVGLITPMTVPFCPTCNRIRVTSDGFLLPCLGSDSAIDLKPALEDGIDLEALMAEAISGKPEAYGLEAFRKSGRGMVGIGG